MDHEEEIFYFEYPEADGSLREYYWYKDEDFLIIMQRITPDYIIVSSFHIDNKRDRKYFEDREKWPFFVIIQSTATEFINRLSEKDDLPYKCLFHKDIYKQEKGKQKQFSFALSFLSGNLLFISFIYYI